MASLVGMIFSARTGGNLSDLAHSLFSNVKARLPATEAELLEISRHRVMPCNGCAYECLLGPRPGTFCPHEDDDTLALWHKAKSCDLLVYFLPTYGGLPPAAWVAFQQRFHGLFARSEAAINPDGKVAVLTLCDPLGSKKGDISQHVILHTLAGRDRPVVCYEQIISSNYGLNSLQDRLIVNAAVQARVAAMGDRIASALTKEAHA